MLLGDRGKRPSTRRCAQRLGRGSDPDALGWVWPPTVSDPTLRFRQSELTISPVVARGRAALCVRARSRAPCPPLVLIPDERMCARAYHKKVFLYDPDSVPADALNMLGRLGFQCIKLTDDPGTFWLALASIDNDGSFVLLSHGNRDGPLMVAGDQGKDMTKSQVEALANTLVQGGVTFYCLSCHTANGDFFETVDESGAAFVAPIGYASFRTSSVSVDAYSVTADGKSYLGWAGTKGLVPTRKTKPLNFKR